MIGAGPEGQFTPEPGETYAYEFTLRQRGTLMYPPPSYDFAICEMRS